MSAVLPDRSGVHRKPGGIGQQSEEARQAGATDIPWWRQGRRCPGEAKAPSHVDRIKKVRQPAEPQHVAVIRNGVSKFIGFDGEKVGQVQLALRSNDKARLRSASVRCRNERPRNFLTKVFTRKADRQGQW